MCFLYIHIMANAYTCHFLFKHIVLLIKSPLDWAQVIATYKSPLLNNYVQVVITTMQYNIYIPKQISRRKEREIRYINSAGTI